MLVRMHDCVHWRLTVCSARMSASRNLIILAEFFICNHPTESDVKQNWPLAIPTNTSLTPIGEHVCYSTPYQTSTGLGFHSVGICPNCSVYLFSFHLLCQTGGYRPRPTDNTQNYSQFREYPLPKSPWSGNVTRSFVRTFLDDWQTHVWCVMHHTPDHTERKVIRTTV